MAVFYEIQGLMLHVRGATFEGEGASRTRKEEESQELRQLRDSYYAHAERLEEHDEVFRRLRSFRFQARAVFGNDVEDAINEILQAKQDVLLAVRWLIRSARDGENGVFFLESRWELEQKIYNGGDEQDEVAKKISAAIMKVEAVCRPLLVM